MLHLLVLTVCVINSKYMNVFFFVKFLMSLVVVVVLSVPHHFTFLFKTEANHILCRGAFIRMAGIVRGSVGGVPASATLCFLPLLHSG